jgi:hypothetical protein
MHTRFLLVRKSWAYLPVLMLMVGVPCGESSASGWWNEGWHFRVPVEFTVGTAECIRKPVEVHVNFTALTSSLGTQGKFDPATLRVVEVNGSGDPLADNVAFQFDQDNDYNDSSNAAGTLVVMLSGTTAASATRTYHVYFDFSGSGVSPATVTPQVSVEDGIWDEGQECWTVSSITGRIFYQKIGAGFSSWQDKDSIDWVSYNPIDDRAAGSSRGLPNACYPRGYFHPGSSGSAASTTTLVHHGPLKATIHAVNMDGDWECQWDFYPEYARFTMLQVDSTYWVLYEGTPGGELEPTVDFITRSTGQQTSCADSLTTDIPDEEWLYFSDPNVNRSLFVGHEEDDDLIDQYYPMTTTTPVFGRMTVFGFGREAARSHLTLVPQHFVYGIMDGTDYSNCAALVRSAMGSVSSNLGQPEKLESAPVKLMSPPDGATHQSRTPKLMWHAYPSATGYRVQVAHDSIFGAGTIVVDASASDTTFTVPAPLNTLSRYYWRVAAVVSSYTLPFGSPWNFLTYGGLPNQVLLVYPENGGWEQHDSVHCRWDSQLGAVKYAIEWTTDSLFAWPDMDSTLTDTTTILSLEVGTYYWRVRARSEAGWGPYSVIRYFNTRLTDVSDSREVPTALRLLQNFPNPFNPSTVIEYALPASGYVNLAVFNTLGQTIAILVNEVQSAGMHRVSFEAGTSVPSGVYFYRVTVNGQTSTRSMLLLR